MRSFKTRQTIECYWWCLFWVVIDCIEVKEVTDQRIRDNWRIGIDTVASEMSSDGRKQCKSLLRPNQKLFTSMKSGNLWILGPHALKNRVITHRNKTCLTAVRLFFQKLVTILPLPFYLSHIMSSDSSIYLNNWIKSTDRQDGMLNIVVVWHVAW
jgi:hypothetical protein